MKIENHEEFIFFQVEILQTHLPTKPQQSQWPPPYYLEKESRWATNGEQVEGEGKA